MLGFLVTPSVEPLNNQHPQDHLHQGGAPPTSHESNAPLPLGGWPSGCALRPNRPRNSRGWIRSLTHLGFKPLPRLRGSTCPPPALWRASWDLLPPVGSPTTRNWPPMRASLRSKRPRLEPSGTGSAVRATGNSTLLLPDRHHASTVVTRSQGVPTAARERGQDHQGGVTRALKRYIVRALWRLWRECPTVESTATDSEAAAPLHRSLRTHTSLVKESTSPK